MRQQFRDLVVFLRGQARKHFLQIGIRIDPTEPRRLDQAHDGGRALSAAQRSREQPPMQGLDDRLGAFLP